jgi:hypothetical protein
MAAVQRLMARRLEAETPEEAVGAFVARIENAVEAEAPTLLSVAEALLEDLRQAMRDNNERLAFPGSEANGLRLLRERESLARARYQLRSCLLKLTLLASKVQAKPDAGHPA